MTSTSVVPRKIGRPSKGNRRRFTIRFPAEQAELVAKQAAAVGMPVSEYVAGLVARELEATTTTAA